MRTHVACAAQIEIGLFESERNRETAVEAVERAAEGGAELVVLPELANLGYVEGHEPEFMRRVYDHAEPVPGPFTEALAAAASRYGVHIVSGVAERHPRLTGVLCNSVVLTEPGGRFRVQRKAHVPREEKHYFAPGSELQPFDTAIGAIGLLVCADNSFPEAARLLALRGAEVLAVVYCARRLPNERLYEYMAATRAYENQVYVVGANRTGRQGELSFQGGTCIAAPDGSVLAALGSEPGLATATLDEDRLLAERLRQTRFRDRRPELYEALSSTEIAG
jgi:omega-amidase